MPPVNCKSVAEGDLATAYLAGELPEAEAEAFEKHYFECGSCRNEVQTRSELRAAFGNRPIAPMTASPQGSKYWRALAAVAAASVLVTFGIRQLVANRPLRAPTPRILRSEEKGSIETKVTISDGRTILEWSPQTDAQTYWIEIFRADGTSVLRRATTATRFALNPADLPSASIGMSLLAKIEARNAIDQVVAESSPQPLPPRPSPERTPR